jgi:hypothetical protein
VKRKQNIKDGKKRRREEENQNVGKTEIRKWHLPDYTILKNEGYIQ